MPKSSTLKTPLAPHRGPALKLLTWNNQKTVKGNAAGYATAILHLWPDILDGRTVCPKSSPGCVAACLNIAGRGNMHKVKAARKQRTRDYFDSTIDFYARLGSDIATLTRYCERFDVLPAVRLNGTSDLNWVKTGILDDWPDVQFYDYTKVFHRLDEMRPKNYHLTFSRDEKNLRQCLNALRRGYNVAVVFKSSPPPFWNDYPVVSGDRHDLRFLDPGPCVVALKAKNRAKHDATGFAL